MTGGRYCFKCGKVHPLGTRCTRRIYEKPDKEKELRSQYAWTKKAKDIKDRSQWLCAVCRKEGRLEYESLEVHHIIKLKDREDLLLDDSNLICLCTFHHKMADAGKISIEELRKLVAERDEVSPPSELK